MVDAGSGNGLDRVGDSGRGCALPAGAGVKDRPAPTVLRRPEPLVAIEREATVAALHRCVHAELSPTRPNRRPSFSITTLRSPGIRGETYWPAWRSKSPDSARTSPSTWPKVGGQHLAFLPLLTYS